MRLEVGSLLFVVGCGGRVEDVPVDTAPDTTVEATVDPGTDAVAEIVDTSVPDTMVAEADAGVDADATVDPFVWARVLGKSSGLVRGPDVVLEPSGRTTFAMVSDEPFSGVPGGCKGGGTGVARFDPVGAPLFVRCYGKELYEGGAVAVAPDGAVWLGTYDARAGVGDVAVTLRRLDAKGELIWEKTLRPKIPSNQTNVRGVVTTAAGDGLVAVELADPVDFGAGPVGKPGQPNVVAKYDASGALLWTRTIANEDLRIGRGSALGATSGGGAIVAGSWQGGTIDLGTGPTSLTDGSYLLVLDPAGRPVWNRTFPYGVYCAWVAANGKGEVVVAGSTGVPFDPGMGGEVVGTKDVARAFVAVYDPTGKPLWATSWPGSANVAAFGGSTVWVAGAQRSSFGLATPRLTHFAADGTTLGEAWPGYVTPIARAMVYGLSVDPTGGLAIVGLFGSPLAFGTKTLAPLVVGDAILFNSTFAARWVP